MRLSLDLSWTKGRSAIGLKAAMGAKTKALVREKIAT
jgi:hypothetical protein